MKGARPRRARVAAAAPTSPRLAPLPRTARIAVGAIAALCVGFTVTTRLYDMDLWQHLAYGRALWTLHRVLTHQQWTWPDFGAPEVNASWGFRALLWPFYSAGGVLGLDVWRWGVALATFAPLMGCARRIGARGVAPWVVLVLGALTYRQRAQIRPEMLAGALLACQLWILETRRHGGPDRSPWLIAIAWGWANVHLSYLLGFAVLGLHLADAQVAAWRRRGPTPRRLWVVGAAAVAVSFANPFGWRALAWPFQFAFQWRHEPLERDVAELAPLLWDQVARAGLPLLIVGWPALALARMRLRSFDRVEAATCALFTLLALSGHRFVATYAIVSIPYVARDLSQALALVPATRWMRPPSTRAALGALACVAVCLPEWANPRLAPGLGLAMPDLPVHACDFLAASGVRGRGMNHFSQGGYQAWRFWPNRERLPFLTIHTEYGTPEQRDLYWRAFFSRAGWRALDQRYHFDYALLRYRQFGDDRLLDILDADPEWALVFVDDAAAVYVRRDGPLAAVAARHAYRLLGAGNARIERLNQEGTSDSTVREQMRAELTRQVVDSPATASAHTMLAYLASFDGHEEAARQEYQRALAVDPERAGAHLGLGLLELDAGRPAGALEEFRAERRIDPTLPDLSFHIARAHLALGQTGAARRWLKDELSRHPGHAEARRALAALGDGAR